MFDNRNNIISVLKLMFSYNMMFFDW